MVCPERVVAGTDEWVLRLFRYGIKRMEGLDVAKVETERWRPAWTQWFSLHLSWKLSEIK